MTLADATSLARTAQTLVVETKTGCGSPPVFPNNWSYLWGAKVDSITINGNSTPSVAVIWFPELRWNETSGPVWGDMIRIRTDEYHPGDRTTVFSGFVTSYQTGFSGGSQNKGSGFERNAIVCLDHRWLLSTTSPIYGQFARGPDDYYNYGTDSQSPVSDSCIFASGRRTIFNGTASRTATLIF